MATATARRATSEASSDLIEHDLDLVMAVSVYYDAVGDGLPPQRMEETIRGWVAGHDRPPGGDEIIDLIMAMALDLTLFTPSLSGATPVDRFLRSAKPTTAVEAEALTALGKSACRLLKILGRESDDLVRLKDLVSGEELILVDARMLPLATDLNVFLRLCPLASGRHISISPLFALDEAMLARAMTFVKPGKGLGNGYRCAAAIYREAARHGVIEVPQARMEDIVGLLDDLVAQGELSEVHILAASWGTFKDDPEALESMVAEIRQFTSVNNLIDALGSYGECDASAPEGLATGFERIAEIQMETMVRREAVGKRPASEIFDEVEAAISGFIAKGQMNQRAKILFDRLKARVTVASTSKPDSVHQGELDRVLQRIQGLRGKTVDQGCTEEEALAAATKVAELLDRYGLTLNEVNIRDELCEGVNVQTSRRRSTSVDGCVQTIATFCDCKAWSEKTASDTIGFVFFGLKADVQAARFLYELIEQTFETETEAFRRRELYLKLAGGDRRTASNSFQLGLANGINMKLLNLKEQRHAAMVKSSGSDLVPLKASVVEDELEKLGMSFTSKTSKRGRFVNGSAYRDGEATGKAFEPHQRID